MCLVLPPRVPFKKAKGPRAGALQLPSASC